MAQPIDLSNLRSQHAARELLKSQAVARDSATARGVDLTHLLQKKTHEHRWNLVGFFNVDDKTMAEMSTQRLKFVNMVAKGEEPNPVDDPPVNLPMDSEWLQKVSGPGCAKCNVHWEDPDGGYGKKCAISDEDWEQAKAQAEGQEMVMRAQMFGKLVEKALAAQ